MKPKRVGVQLWNARGLLEDVHNIFCHVCKHASYGIHEAKVRTFRTVTSCNCAGCNKEIFKPFTTRNVMPFMHVMCSLCSDRIVLVVYMTCLHFISTCSH